MFFIVGMFSYDYFLYIIMIYRLFKIVILNVLGLLDFIVEGFIIGGF